MRLEHLTAAISEVRYAFRQLRQSPGFAVLAVLTLALGIGAHTAMWTVIQGVILRPLPYKDAERIVFIAPKGKDGFAKTSWLNYRDILDQAADLESVGCYTEDLGVVQTASPRLAS
jgi:putative ABC transport system permease protein